MKTILHRITDAVSTKKGMWITLITWLVVTMALAVFAPSAKEYELTGTQLLPDDAQSIIADKKLNEYFKDDKGIPALLVFHNKKGEVDAKEISRVMDKIEGEKIEGIKDFLPFSKLPPQVQTSFYSEDKSTAVLPVNLKDNLENKEIQQIVDKIVDVEKGTKSDVMFRVTGPAGIAGDTLKLFSQADVVLLLSTVGLILVLLIVIYRSPLLALIPLLAAVFVYEVVNQTLGLMGKAGLDINNQTLSIMTILLFAAVIDYSLFVFARYREELTQYHSKYDAMKQAMHHTGEPVFFSGGTVLVAMLILFFANFGDYKNFAPVFGTTMAIIMIASITLVPALFALFGRKAFWPRIPKVGSVKENKKTIWSRLGRVVSAKPLLTGGLVGIFLIVSALNVFNLKYEFDTVKTFPKDMPSREGYEIVESKFDKGVLAPTTVLLEGKQAFSDSDIKAVQDELASKKHVATVRLAGNTEDKKVVKYSLTFDISPYSIKALDALVDIRDDETAILKTANIDGDLHFAGVTAKQADERSINDRDLVVIVGLETLFIFVMLLVLTRSIKMPIYMMGTILVSFVAALGLGTFLTDVLFDIEAISSRVPIYAFVFLVALGVDYNIILVSRFKEERQKHSVKKAVEIAVARTGGVISSAGLILAATFAVLMTQPIAVLFVFGFIVAIGILLDTFLVRGILLPALLVLFEKDDKKKIETDMNA
ncbi:MAG: MMPL family transporter [Bacillaceae bacterium]